MIAGAVSSPRGSPACSAWQAGQTPDSRPPAAAPIPRRRPPRPRSRSASGQSHFCVPVAARAPPRSLDPQLRYGRNPVPCDGALAASAHSRTHCTSPPRWRSSAAKLRLSARPNGSAARRASPAPSRFVARLAVTGRGTRAPARRTAHVERRVRRASRAEHRPTAPC